MKNYFLCGILMVMAYNTPVIASDENVIENKKVYDCSLELFVNYSHGSKKKQRIEIPAVPSNGLYTDPIQVALLPEMDKLKKRKHYFTFYYPSIINKNFRLKLSVVFLDGRTQREHVSTEASNAKDISLVASEPNKRWDPSLINCQEL